MSRSFVAFVSFAALVVWASPSPAAAQEDDWDDRDWGIYDYQTATAASHAGLGVGLTGVAFGAVALATQTYELLVPAAIMSWAVGPPLANGAALAARKALKRLDPYLELTAAPGAVGFIFWVEFPPLSYIFAGVQLGKNHEAWKQVARGGERRDEEPSGPRYWDLDEEEDEDWNRLRVRAGAPVVLPIVSPTWSDATVAGRF
ncbi:MAG: hypothetical protein GY898_14980 [Proteobacteria bacterium]|nr:hypothetical protein [Pseudomonadota bacterium]